MQGHRGGVLPVFPRGEAVGLPEGTGKGLMGGKTVVQGDFQKAVPCIPYRRKGKGQPPVPEIFPQPHPRNLPEHPGKMVFRVPQLLSKPAQGQGLVAALPDALVYLFDDARDIPVPLPIHLAFPPFFSPIIPGAGAFCLIRFALKVPSPAASFPPLFPFPPPYFFPFFIRPALRGPQTARYNKGQSLPFFAPKPAKCAASRTLCAGGALPGRPGKEKGENAV